MAGCNGEVAPAADRSVQRTVSNDEPGSGGAPDQGFHVTFGDGHTELVVADGYDPPAGETADPPSVFWADSPWVFWTGGAVRREVRRIPGSEVLRVVPTGR